MQAALDTRPGYTLDQIKAAQQRTFNKVLAHLRVQGHASRAFVMEHGSASMCAYRGDDNSKCAVGICLPDANYGVALEGAPVFELMELLEPDAQLAGLDFMSELQGTMHDHLAKSNFKRDLERGAKFVANHWDLEYKPA